ncbi:response regulator [Alteromonas sediminis]|uniref:Response regulator n=1 Tax=Alteromonas sediminis TaxID=2259342 RepID=A0A3N5ZBA4_9ALTE|nr:fused response regulator/phosphatase [Alteromonas sediminis]RPJ68544.1 response regulator [Alteromonas sediminis]
MTSVNPMLDMRILVADDEPINRFLLLHMLEEQGFKECFEAENGREAVELARQISPDLILLDIDMPEMSGFEAAEILKNEAEIHLPIIFITATEDKENLIKCLKVGGDDFAIKPFDKAILSAKINAHLRSRRMSQHIDAQNKELSKFRAEVDQEHAMIEHIYNHALTNPEHVMAYFDVLQQPAANFNGDLFLVQPHPNGGLYFFLGDFTGHGLASTVGALPVSRTFTAMAVKGLSVVEIAQAINELLYTFLPIDRFSAATLGYVNETGTRVTIWQGGMPDFYIQRSADKSVYAVSSEHMALGVLEPSDFDSDCNILDLEAGDTLTLFSDGLIEASFTDEETGEESNEWLGEEAVRNWLLEYSDLTSQKIFELAKKALKREYFDDDVAVIRFEAKDLQSLKSQESHISLPFLFSVSLGPDELRSEYGLNEVFHILNSQSGLGSVRADLFTAISEMYTNALEHGVLGLSSSLKDTPDGFMEYYQAREAKLAELEEGFVRIDINMYPKEGVISVAVSDSGSGFDYKTAQQIDDEASSGRGIMLLNEICESLWFEGNGNRIVVEMKI